MSDETTNTPNGGSKDLYAESKDDFVVIGADMSEQDPEKDMTGYVPGDNTNLGEEYSYSIVNTAIEDNGYVKIMYGSNVRIAPDGTKKVISNKDIKALLISKGAKSFEDYIADKVIENREVEEKEEKEEEKE